MYFTNTTIIGLIGFQLFNWLTIKITDKIKIIINFKSNILTQKIKDNQHLKLLAKV